MEIYLDLVLILNFAFDFLLLLGVAITLKRGKNINRIILGAFAGSFSIFSLFIKMNSLSLFLIKIIISIIMCIISFGYKNIRYTFKNIIFIFMEGIILGGFIYFLNIQFSYKNEGIVFYHKGLSINFIFLLIISPIIIYIYIKQNKSLKTNYNNYYNVDIIFDKNKKLNTNAYLDTGHKLLDPYKHRPILLLDKRKIFFDINEFKMVLVPYRTVNGSSLMKCFKIEKIVIDKVGIRKNLLVGLIDNINIDDIDCIINQTILEG